MACQPCVIFILGQITMTEKYCLSGLVGTVTVSIISSSGNVENVSLLDMPTHCALYRHIV